MPTLLASLDANASWIEAHPEEPALPRMVGEHEFTIGGRRGRRMIRAYSQWMLQRPLDYYRSLEGSAREEVEALLARVGGVDSMQTPIRRRVARRDNRLVPEDGAA